MFGFSGFGGGGEAILSDSRRVIARKDKKKRGLWLEGLGILDLYTYTPMYAMLGDGPKLNKAGKSASPLTHPAVPDSCSSPIT